MSKPSYLEILQAQVDFHTGEKSERDIIQLLLDYVEAQLLKEEADYE